MKNLLIFSLIAIFFSCSNQADYTTAAWLEWDKDSVSRFPTESWMKYKIPEEAGWSTEKLKEAKRYWEKSQSSAFLVIYDGAILVSWGEVDRRFLLHSANKSLINAPYGIAIEKGIVDLKSTIGELGITEITPLSLQEKSVTVNDLLKFRSGVYIRGALSLIREYPKRGSAKPGEKWFYNNWDINVSTYILEKEWSKPFEAIFKESIADPLMMEAFRTLDVDKVTEEIRSKYPARMVRMTALDLARYGLLYLNNGKWKNQQIVSDEWVNESTYPHSRLDKSDIGGGSDYGYNWWINDDRFKNLGMYSANGLLGQRLRVIPKADLVLVNLNNTYKRHEFKEEDQLELLDKILAARISKPKDNPKLVELARTHLTEAPQDSIPSQFLGEYVTPYTFDPELATMTVDIKYTDDDLVADFQYGGSYKMIKVSENTYILEDLDSSEEKRFPLKFMIQEGNEPVIEAELAFLLEKTLFRKVKKSG